MKFYSLHRLVTVCIRRKFCIIQTDKSEFKSLYCVGPTPISIKGSTFFNLSHIIQSGAHQIFPGSQTDCSVHHISSLILQATANYASQKCYQHSCFSKTSTEKFSETCQNQSTGFWPPIHPIFCGCNTFNLSPQLYPSATYSLIS